MQIFKNLSRKTGQREETSTLIWYQKAIKDKSRGGGGNQQQTTMQSTQIEKQRLFQVYFPLNIL